MDSVVWSKPENQRGGTPLLAEISARGDLATATAAVAEEMTKLLGDGPVTGAMTAHVLEAVNAAPRRTSRGSTD